MKILITGSEGFFGKNVKYYLEKNKIKYCEFNKKNNYDDLKLKIRESNIIFHLAGEVLSESIEPLHNDNNVKLTQFIVKEINKYSKKRLIYASTIHVINPKTIYAKTKLEAEKYIMSNLSKKSSYCIIRYPHLFGPYGKPNHNSVLTTWIFDELHKRKSQITKPDLIMSYGYIDEVVLNLVENGFQSQSYTYTYDKVYKITLESLRKMITDIVLSLDSGKVIFDNYEAFYSRLYFTISSYYLNNR